MTAGDWRQGGKVPQHVYRQKGDKPNREPQPHGDEPIAMFTSARDAEIAVKAVNEMLWRRRQK